jgi:hypothetical protein
MIIAIDYDGTYAADPETFDKVIKLFQEAGHTVICVTGRDGGAMGDIVRATIGQLIPIVFAGPEWKKVAAKNQGYNVDVWVDDVPNMISPQNPMSPRNLRGSNG